MRYISVVTFLSVVVALLIFLLRFFTQMGDGGETYVIAAFFEHTGGINKGNPVKMVGSTIGSVASVELDMERRGVKMLLNINAGIKIPKDSVLKVAEKGMLGEMYLFFSFGKSNDFVKPGEEVLGNPPVALSDLMGNAGDTIDGVGSELTAVLQKLNKLLSTPGFSENIAATVAEAPGLLNNLTGMVSDARPVLNQVLVNLQEVTGNLNSTLKTLDDEMTAMADRKTLEKLDGVVENIDALVVRVDKVVAKDVDPAMDELSGIMTSLHKTIKEIAQVAQTIQPVIAGLGPESQGSMAQMIHGGQLSEQIGAFLTAGTDLLELLEEQPSSIIFGKRKRRDDDTPRLKSRINATEEFKPTVIKAIE